VIVFLRTVIVVLSGEEITKHGHTSYVRESVLEKEDGVIMNSAYWYGV
jgi:hypothetical protein